MDKYGATAASSEWEAAPSSGPARSSSSAGGASKSATPAVPRARFVGGLVLLGVCGLALVAGSLRTPVTAPATLDESSGGSTDPGKGNKQSGQPAPLACEAHLRSEMVFKGVEITNLTKTQKTLFETVAEDAIGKVLNAMTGFQAMTAIWSYPVDGKCWVKFYFQVEFIVIPGSQDQDEISTGEELTNRAMRYLVKHIQNGDMQEQWVDSNLQLGSDTFIFGNVSKATLEGYFDEEMSIYAVDEDTKLLWLETCTPPSLAPAATYTPSISPNPVGAPSGLPSVAPTTCPSTYVPTAAPQVPYPSPTVGPVIPPTPRPSSSPSEAPTPYHTRAPSIKPTEAHMSCVPSPCPGRKLDEFGVEIDDPDYVEDEEASDVPQIADAAAAAFTSAYEERRSEATHAVAMER